MRLVVGKKYKDRLMPGECYYLGKDTAGLYLFCWPHDYNGNPIQNGRYWSFSKEKVIEEYSKLNPEILRVSKAIKRITNVNKTSSF